MNRTVNKSSFGLPHAIQAVAWGVPCAKDSHLQWDAVALDGYHWGIKMKE